jgi:N-ethylmaleimide reductase
MAAHYAQRARAGLLITEATLVSEESRGFPNTPGIYSDAQEAGWRAVLEAVRAVPSHGLVFCQLWHIGRAANPALGGVPLGPSAVEGWANMMGAPSPAPAALDEAGIARILGDFRAAARRAGAAGFDGVEIHGANGYLPNQFLCSNSNLRDDAWGGDVPRRARFLIEAVKGAVAELGADRVGVRISPASHWQGVHDADPVALFTHVARELQALGIAYLHVVEPRDTGLAPVPTDAVDASLTGASLRKAGFTGPILSAGGHDFASGADYVASGAADAVVYGRHFISNPDLVTRFEKMALGDEVKLNAYDRSTFCACSAARR